MANCIGIHKSIKKVIKKDIFKLGVMRILAMVLDIDPFSTMNMASFSKHIEFKIDEKDKHKVKQFWQPKFR